MLLSIIGFLVILGPLVIVHEFGHFIFARLFNVKAEVFSIGFGPKIWSRQRGETEWRVSAIPLGGYVKLLGEDPSQELPLELQKRSLQRQARWKRLFIFAGGPLFNFVFAIFIFMAIMLIGEPQVASVIGRVTGGSPAEKAGFESGDRIVSIDGQAVRKYDEVLRFITENPGKPLHFQVVHPKSADPVAINAVPTPVEGYSIYGENTKVGDIDGLVVNARSNLAGVSNPSSPAGKAGIKTGDKIVALNSTPIDSWETLEREYKELPVGGSFTLKVESAYGAKHHEVPFTKSGPSLGGSLGLYSSELFVEKTIEKSPAEAAGIKPGDRIDAVGNQPLTSFFELREGVQKAGEKDGKVLLTWERNGQRMSATIVPTATTVHDPALKRSSNYTVGVMPQLVLSEPPVFVERILNPFMLLWKGTERTVVFSWRNVVSLAKMLKREVSVATLGGPILIGKIAGESLSRGLIAFLTTMAILSVGLGILNILPIPILDGGHILLLGIEAIRGKQLSMRQMEWFQQVGLTLILILMAIVLRNDFLRVL